MIGKTIGPYRIEKRIGRGGMGDVYLVVRNDGAFRRRMALKLVRQQADASIIGHRFQSERQILASLDHPNIARLLDGGSTDDGRPYLVMEYIDGQRLDRYADEHRLGVEERLELFLQVCSAVQTAHQNLVVHRDLKPGNILVTRDGVPKLLDFGIAKLLAPELFPHTVEMTRTEMRPMTPQYASPEQLLGQPVTTASDVYSLGVLLYQLLTGHLPRSLPSLVPQDIQRALDSDQPTKPSVAVLRTKGDEASGTQVTPELVSRVRSTRVDALRRQLTGDLDNIVLMALRREPHRRYASVDQLTEDIRRHLEGLPVHARPDTFRYRTSKFMRRNGLSVALGGALTVMALGFVGTVGYQAAEISSERDRFELERDKAQRVAGFMLDLLRMEDAESPDAEAHRQMVQEILDRGTDRLAQTPGDPPEIRAILLHTLGGAYFKWGLTEDARPLVAEAVRLREGLIEDSPGNAELDLAESLSLLAEIDHRRGAFEPSLRASQRALDIYRGYPRLQVLQTLDAEIPIAQRLLALEELRATVRTNDKTQD